MSSFQFLVFTLCAAAVAKHGKHHRDCKVDNFKFQEDFNMTRHPRKLYSQLYFNATVPTLPVEDNVVLVTSLRPDAVTYTVIARVTSNGQCVEWSYTVANELGTPKLNITFATPSGFRSVRYYVAATDYKKYMMLYYCKYRNSDGVCTEGSLDYLSIDSKPRERDLERAKNLAKKYCLDNTKFYNFRSGNGVCPAAEE